MPFIAFEGLDGSGKSTLIKGLVEALQEKDISHVVTREPGGTELGDAIRELLLRVEGESPTPRTELLLYEASRAQHVDQLIRPSLENNKWVLCDRFSASSVAFQEGGRGLPLPTLKWLNDFATDNIYPDLWVLLDLAPEVSVARMAKRHKELGQELDRFEREKHDFHERVRQSYLRQAQAEPEKWLVLDASQSPEQLQESLLAEVAKRGWL